MPQTTLQNDTIIIGQDAFTSSSIAYHKLGQLATDGTGRYFRYVLAGGTSLVPGKLQQSPVENTTNYEDLTIVNPAVGATSVTTSTTVTITANAYAGGYMVVTTGTLGIGYTYRIKGNTAATAAVVTIYLEDPIIVATTGTAKIDVVVNPYQGVIVNPASATGTPVGAAIYPVTNAQYGWVQVKGPCALLADGAVVVGTSLVASNAVAGAVEALAGVQASVGLAITGIATTEYGLVYLNLP